MNKKEFILKFLDEYCEKYGKDIFISIIELLTLHEVGRMNICENYLITKIKNYFERVKTY